jgi:flavin reductase (DIM6/NTAB) family NADH-FMN oxidoreductase RutF
VEESSAPVTPGDLRSAMGRFATGVTIVSTRLDDGVHAMTANAFMSVSLDPPLVMVSLGNRSRMAGMLEVGSSYGVTVLTNAQESLARHFAGSARSANPAFQWFDDVPVVAAGAVQLAATVVDAHPAGDHTLFIGEVTQLASRDAEPLIFHTGAFKLVQVAMSDEVWWD